VTGFGILGHGNNLAKNQKQQVQFVIETFPIIKNLKKVEDKVQMFSLLQGVSSETSGFLESDGSLSQSSH